jgi:hypothetical protein
MFRGSQMQKKSNSKHPLLPAAGVLAASLTIIYLPTLIDHHSKGIGHKRFFVAKPERFAFNFDLALKVTIMQT